MGRRQKEPADRPTYITAGFYAGELRVIEETMKRWGCSQSQALRILVRMAAGAPAPQPFTPEGEEPE